MPFIRTFLFIAITFFFPQSIYAKRVILRVFHAGSLSVPFSKMEQEFEKKYPYIDIRREVSGSVKAIRKVIDLHKRCDVIAVADYSLIPEMMFPKYADYVKIFARNEIVICYTSRSDLSEKINKDNWFQILYRTKWGFSNPMLDPCGYRTLITISLSEMYYNKSGLMKKLLGKNTNIRFRKERNKIIFELPKQIRTRENIYIRDKSVSLLGLLESGAIDYAFEYKSVAIQHNLFFLQLPDEINLGSLKFKDFYERAIVRFPNGKVIKGKPILYGITVLKDAPHPKEARMWEDFVTGKEGRKILLKCNQIPIFPPKIIK